MHTVTKISEDSETASYIFFLINNKIKNKQPPNCNCLHSISHFNSLPQLLTKSQKRPYIMYGQNVGIYLSFRAASRRVFSAQASLTSVFGMGTGGPSPQSTPTIVLTPRIYNHGKSPFSYVYSLCLFLTVPIITEPNPKVKTFLHLKAKSFNLLSDTILPLPMHRL